MSKPKTCVAGIKHKLVKCKPLECKQFMRIFNKFWDKRPVDIFIMMCKRRIGNNCTHFKRLK